MSLHFFFTGVGSLKEIVATLTREADALRTNNADLERKIATILAKLAMFSNTSNQRAGIILAGGPVEEKESAENLQIAEKNSEKERLYFETVKLIAIGRKKLEKQQTDYQQLSMDLQTRLDDKELKVTEISEAFKAFKEEILCNAVNSRTGLPLPKSTMLHFEQAEKKKGEELEKVRLRNISLQQSIKKLERTLKSREQLAEGLHMIDFEQLKIENQTLNEKIEERNEEYTKLKRKKVMTIQVLTHVREKLRYVRKKSLAIRQTLEVLDSEINVQRGFISTAKKDRDVIKDAHQELKRLHGFAGSDLLLQDYEKRRSDIESIKVAIKELQERKQLLNDQIRSNSKKTKEAVMMHRGSNTGFLPPLGRK